MLTTQTHIILSLICLLCQVQRGFSAGGTVDYSYSGATGPSKWGDIKADYATCKTGKFQSPTNLLSTEVEKREVRVNNWQDITGTIPMKNNGLAIDLEVPENSNASAKFADTEYKLKSMHYHMPSEHFVDGKHFEGEMHFVHKTSNGSQILVIGAFLSLSNSTAQPNPFIEQFKNKLPQKDGNGTLDGLKLTALQQSINMQEFFTYRGSLTTPPCSENVRWIVLKSPVTINLEQYTMLKNAVPYNSRGPQENMDLEGRRKSPSKSGDQQTGGNSPAAGDSNSPKKESTECQD